MFQNIQGQAPNDEYGETDTIDYSIEEILDMPFME